MTDAAREALLREATMLMKAGRDGEALAAFERLLAQWPDLPNSWYNLGLLRKRAGRFDDALAAYQEALTRGAHGPEEIHLNRAVIFADHLRREDEAERELRAALALNSRYAPALMNLGNLHEDRGDRAAAIAQYEAALGADSLCFDALARIAGAMKVMTADDPIIARLRAAVDHPAASAAEKANVGFALGKALDEAGAYDAAFEAYCAANLASKEGWPRRSAFYDRAAQERQVDAIMAAFPKPRASSGEVQGSPLPLFVCGMFRSGSTLTEQVLAAHPLVTAGGELSFVPQLATAPGYPQAVAILSAAEIETQALQYLAQMRQAFPGAAIVTDKRPDNFLHVGLIKTLFPAAKIVHTTRNLLDNCLSVYFLHLDHSMGYALDLEDIGHYALQERRLMAHWKALYGDDILDFDYDEFVAAPREQTARLLAFCGLEWDEACLSFHEVRNAVKTASVWQVREPLYRRSSGRWKNYARHLERLRAFLGYGG